MLFKVLSVVLLPKKLAPSHGKSFRLVYFCIVLVNVLYMVDTVMVNCSYRLKFLEEEVGHQPLLTRTKVSGR